MRNSLKLVLIQLLPKFSATGFVAVVCLLVTDLWAAERHVPRDHVTIQQAIDASTGGDVILVASGTYREPLELKPNIVLRSAGGEEHGDDFGMRRAQATIIDLGGKVTDAPGITMAEGSTLDGFTITGVGKYDDASWSEHHATRGENQKHEHIGGFHGPAIGITGVSCTVMNCIVHHNGSTGIAIRGVKDKTCEPLIQHNICYRNMGGGIGAMNGCGGRISENRCYENFYAGIGHNGGHPAVLNNICYENIRAGIGISEGACPVVRRNKCYRNRRAGIGARTKETTQPLIADNECYENGMAGIGCEEDARPTIRGNHCHHNEMAGIGARDGAAPVITGNLCEGNKLAGIGCRDGARPLIQGNTSRKNEMAGIGVRGTGTFATIRNNRCEDNKLVAIGLPDGASALIESNYVIRTGGVPPLVAIKGGAHATLIGNEFHGGGVACVLVDGRAQLIGNNLKQQGDVRGSGVWVWKESHLAAGNNTIDGFANGINAAGTGVNLYDNMVRNFRTAIRVADSTSPANVFGNRAEANDTTPEQAFVIRGEQGIVVGNKVMPLTADSR